MKPNKRMYSLYNIFKPELYPCYTSFCRTMYEKSKCPSGRCLCRRISTFSPGCCQTVLKTPETAAYTAAYTARNTALYSALYPVLYILLFWRFAPNPIFAYNHKREKKYCALRDCLDACSTALYCRAAQTSPNKRRMKNGRNNRSPEGYPVLCY